MIDNIDTSGLVYAAGVIFAAYVVRGIAGFGSGLIAIPLLALQYPLPIVVPIVVFLDYLGSASQAHGNQRRIVWSDLLPLIPFTLFGVVVGVFLLSTMDKVWLGRALGVFVLAYAIYQLLPLPDLKGSRLFAIPCGLAGGGIGTLLGAGGPLYVIYFNLLGIPKDHFRATFAANFMIDGGIRLIAYVVSGLVYGPVLLGMLASLPPMAAGLWMGGRINSGLSQQRFKLGISILLLCSGTVLLLRH